MFDLGSWGEFILIALAALVLIGPKEMPALLKALGRWSYKGKKAFENFRRLYAGYLQEGEIEAYIQDTNDKVLTKKETPGEGSLTEGNLGEESLSEEDPSKEDREETSSKATPRRSVQKKGHKND